MNKKLLKEGTDYLFNLDIYKNIYHNTKNLSWNELPLYIAFKIEILLICFLATLDIRKMHYERIKNEINYIYQKSPSRKISVVQRKYSGLKLNK
jgi:hypothetical protein